MVVDLNNLCWMQWCAVCAILGHVHGFMTHGRMAQWAEQGLGSNWWMASAAACDLCDLIALCAARPVAFREADMWGAPAFL
jgi:hypothetical protein